MAFRFLLTGAAIALLLACNVPSEGTPSIVAPPELTIRECDDYATAYERCLSRLDPSDDSQARRRTALTREVLVAQESTAAAREELRQTCIAGLDRLRAACP